MVATKDISLDVLLKKPNSGEADIIPAQENLPAQMSFSTEEQNQIAKIKDSINLQDSNNILQFGNIAQNKIASFSNSVLENVKTKDSGHVGELLNSLVSNIEEYTESDTKKFLKKIPLIRSLVSKTENLADGYSSLSTQVEKISGELEVAKVDTLKNIKLFDVMYQKNYEYYKELCMYIEAGDAVLKEVQEITLPKLKEEAQRSSDLMSQQAVADFESTVSRFEKRLHDLKLSKTISIQTAPQIRLIQNNDKILVDKIQGTILNTIPLWKNQMVIALGLEKQSKVLGLQRVVTDATNNLLRQNAELLKTNTVETAKENERSIVDVDTVQKVNADLIETIKQTLEIQQEGRVKRQEAERQLLALENEMKNVLLSVSK